VYYFNSTSSNGGLIEKIKNNSVKLGFTTGENELLDDLTIENNQCYRQAEIHSDILASVLGTRASIVGNNLNVLMKSLHYSKIEIFGCQVGNFSRNIPLTPNDYEMLVIAKTE
jgi:magnesium transporter